MNRAISIFCMTSFLVIFLFACRVMAYDQAHFNLLKNKNQCQNCDLSRANLSYMDLREAYLRGSDLSNVNLNQTKLGNADL